MKLQKTNTGQYLVTIPKQIIKIKKWRKGQEFLPSINEKGRLELIPVD